MELITISRQFGAGGEIVGKIVAEKLGFLLVNQELINEGLLKLGIPAQSFSFEKSTKEDSLREKKRRFYLTALHEYLIELAAKQPIVLLGRGGTYLFKDTPHAYHVRIQAPLVLRLKWVQDVYKIDEKTGMRLIQEKDRAKKKFVRDVFDQSWTNIDHFDLVINTGKITPQKAAKLVVLAFNSRRKDLLLTEEIKKITIKKELKKHDAQFMHPSEKEFAQFLDYYKIAWEYEPKTFPLAWDTKGNVTEAFSPDFYLPDFNTYIELTTQRQKLVWKKNKKLRRLKELYPDIQVKIVYGKDYKNLLKKITPEKP